MSKKISEAVSEHLARLGRRGGKSRSKRKKAAALSNLEKALAKRWGKKITLRRVK